MTELHIDFETRSTVDLPKRGVDNYSRHADTDVWCMAYAFGDDPVELWTPDQPMPFEVLDHIAGHQTVIAHNAQFELAIWNNLVAPRYGQNVEMSVAQLVDTAAMAYAMALPGSLDGASKAAGLDVEKDMAGNRLMLQMAKPRRIEDDGTIIWWDDDDRKQRLFDYCRQDVEVERQLDNRLRRLSEAEQAVWVVDQRINLRGVPVDLDAIGAVNKMIDAYKPVLDERMSKLTGGQVTACSQVIELRTWLEQQGVETDTLAKDAVASLLEDDSIPYHAREALILRQTAAKTSTAKAVAMRDAASADGRVRHTMQYHGAGTGRWAGRKIQVQNFPRGFLKPHQVEEALDLILDGQTEMVEILFGDPMEVASSCLRGLIAAPTGQTFSAADWSNIEGRGLAWHAGEESKLDVFRSNDAGTGPDPYIVAAEEVERLVPKLKGNVGRQGGKVCELALGYQGGIGAFQSMARVYGFSVPDETAEIIKAAWREAHPNISKLWYATEKAAVSAVLNPGEVYTAGAKGREVKYRVAGSFLWCRLPSGRLLCYPYPELKKVDTPWGSPKDQLSYMTVNQKTRKWSREKTYGGKLVENNIQAICSDILRASLIECEQRNLEVFMHVHDEILIEHSEKVEKLDELISIMETLPEWAAGFPIKAAGWTGKRFRKD